MSVGGMSGVEGTGLAGFNARPAEEARAGLLECCRAERWAAQVTSGRPYSSLGALQARAAEALTDEDVTEALAGHPRIGQAPAAGHSSWSRSEQSGVAGADQAVRAGLAAGNQAYETRFGHIYLVCAAGRSATELLAILQARLANDPETERQVMRGELIKINNLRLAQLIGTEAP
jgi:2-oxo-4-hydroxy-4-carboxy-5-ureidoimidazoline decarboxylase